MKGLPTQHNKHHLKANDRKQTRNHLQKMQQPVPWLVACPGPAESEFNWQHAKTKTIQHKGICMGRDASLQYFNLLGVSKKELKGILSSNKN